MLGCQTALTREEVGRVDRQEQIRERLATDELEEGFLSSSFDAAGRWALLAAVPHQAGDPLTSRPHSSAVSMNASTLSQGTSIGRTLEGPGMAPPPVE